MRALAEQLGERNVRDAPRFFHLERAATRIEHALGASLAARGLRPTRRSFRVGAQGVRTLEAELPGARAADDVVVVAARYDSPAGSAGVNDNATGVAALLALAERWASADRTAALTVRFVALPSGPLTPLPASRVYAAHLREHGTRVRGVLCLEALGRSARGARTEPLMVVSNLASRRLARTVTWALGQGDVRGRAAFVPGTLPGVGASDPGAFWRQGLPAVRVTEVFPMSTWRADERVEQLDFARLATVVRGLERVLERLTDAEH
ncbi:MULTISPECIES: M28 family peptidase [Myxococcaceae]|uniref:M28 family metallopeptidase n=1 Tax=Myxococcaceae TaxID=31 RepID=UPI00188F9AE9|nr:M28 family peptidase [Simulacricoccus sp. 17bor-14]